MSSGWSSQARCPAPYRSWCGSPPRCPLEERRVAVGRAGPRRPTARASRADADGAACGVRHRPSANQPHIASLTRRPPSPTRASPRRSGRPERRGDAQCIGIRRQRASCAAACWRRTSPAASRRRRNRSSRSAPACAPRRSRTPPPRRQDAARRGADQVTAGDAGRLQRSSIIVTQSADRRGRDVPAPLPERPGGTTPPRAASRRAAGGRRPAWQDPQTGRNPSSAPSPSPGTRQRQPPISTNDSCRRLDRRRRLAGDDAFAHEAAAPASPPASRCAASATSGLPGCRRTGPGAAA